MIVVFPIAITYDTVTGATISSYKMNIKLFSCDCLYKEIGNKVADSSAKGYVLVSECDDCKNKREVENEKRAIEEQVAKEDELLQAQKKESAKIKLLNLGLTKEEIESLYK